MDFEETIARWYSLWESGNCVGILGQELFNLPCAQTVCVNPDHLGFGAFVSKRNGHKINFDGGGASIRSIGPDGERFSWTPITGTPEALAEFNLFAGSQRTDFEEWQK
jgi:hypothetical protein